MNTSSNPEKQKIHALLADRPFLFLDGGMGTMLQQSGLKLGERPEILSLTDPDVVRSIHQAYIDSGSDIIYSNTFGANAHKLEGTGHSVDEVVTASVRIAREACGDSALTALDIGPIGEMLEPYGTLSFEGAYDLFREMLVSGEKAGADLVIFETMTDLYEVKAAVLAALENTTLPIFVTMTFEQSGRTFTGTCVESMACVLEGLGVDAIGINCSLGPDEIYPIAERLVQCTALPVIIKANAGLPDPETGDYSIDAEQFGRSMRRYADLGIRFAGGCCGTDPDFIRAIRTSLKDLVPAERPPVRRVTRVCTPTGVVEIDRVRVIGERINPTGKKRFQKALIENDIDYILQQGIQQMEAGADILDVNVGLPEINEPEMMVRVVKNLQAVIDIPLQIDSSDPEAIEAGLRVCNGKAIVNSINGKPETMERILPIVKKYGAAVLGLALDEGGIPETAEGRFAIAERIVRTAESYGIPHEDIFIDCLTLTVSAQQSQAMETLKAVRRVREELGVHAVLGVSNISFGLPYRELVNHTFLTMAMTNGLDLPIINPNIPAMMNAVLAFNVLTGVDRDCEKYIDTFAGYVPPAPSGSGSTGGTGGSGAPAASGSTGASTGNAGSTDGASGSAGTSGFSGPPDGARIFHAIEKGLKEEAARAVQELTETHEDMVIINEYLIPALDRVGDRFDQGTLFLPQLLNAAAAASEAFEVIKQRIAQSDTPGVSKGTIIMATVHGDIHDIGKNIVKVILENYGYTVLDLGRDVPVETVVEAAIENDVKLVGLSALMTTTLVSMEETIRALKDSGHECQTMVGGAVLTPEYAEKMGADFYARDAKASVDIAKKVFH